MASPTPREIAMEARKREFDAKRRAANRQKGANLLGMAQNPGALLRGAADIPGSVYRYLRGNEPVEIGEDVSRIASDMAGDFRKDPVKFAVDMVNPMSSVQDFADIRAQARDLRAAGDLDTAAMLEQVAAMSPLAVVPVVGKVLSKGAKKAAKKAASLAVKPAKAAAEKTAPLAVKPLAMDETSRMARANKLFPVSAYHGSPRDIKRFETKYGSPEGHYGANHYFTTSLDDVNQNYAGEGPDLTGRIERVLERNADGGDDYHLRELAQERGLDFDSLSHGEVEQLARDSARAALGIENQGTVYPVRLRMEKPVVVGGKGETHWPYKYETDEAGDFIGESGEALDLLRHTREAMNDWNVDPHTSEDVVGKLSEVLSDYEGLPAGEFEKAIRQNVTDLYDDATGDMASPGALLADIYQRMGHDSVDMDASVFGARRGAMGTKIPGMVGVNDARHYIVFDPKRIRSRFAAFDPDKLDSSDLSHAHGGRVSSLAVKRKGKK